MEQTKAIEMMNAVSDDGYEAEVRDDYSGRGMYGKETHAVVTDASPVTFAAIVGTDSFRADSMGLGYVYY